VKIFEFTNIYQGRSKAGPETTQYGSFHSKGIWLKQEGDEHYSDYIIGSSGLNKRAYELDYEVQNYISSHDRDLSDRA
jgi:phosphatidylserine/phosphatidylglycerophosphate/cardiolipin synthase-like enzyme